MTCCTDGRYLNLLYIDPANKHDITIIKENEEDFSERFSGCTVLLDKGYIDEKFSEAMRAKGVEYIAIKRDNMVKSEHERHYYQLISRIRRVIETRFAQLEEFGARIIRAVSRKSLAVKITLSILTFNIHQMMKGALMGTRVLLILMLQVLLSLSIETRCPFLCWKLRHVNKLIDKDYCKRRRGQVYHLTPHADSISCISLSQMSKGPEKHAPVYP